jgi:hypothetical protein
MRWAKIRAQRVLEMDWPEAKDLSGEKDLSEVRSLSEEQAQDKEIA